MKYFCAFLTFCVLVLFHSPIVSAQKISYKDGVKIVENGKPLWGNKPKIRLEFVRRIGEIESENENLMFNKPVDFTLDKAGNIYITDMRDCYVKVFTEGLRHIKKIGRKGQGPGEFVSPHYTEIDENGRIYVIDHHNVSVFSLEGEYITRFKHKGWNRIVFQKQNRFVIQLRSYNI